MPDKLVGLRRLLRTDSTDAERRLWRLLRDRRTRAKFRRQHSFGPFVVDLYCAAAGLIVEADGGHHHEPEQAAYDAHRTSVLEALGLRVVRFDNAVVLHFPELVLEAIIAALAGRPHPAGPHPSPLPVGERGRKT